MPRPWWISAVVRLYPREYRERYRDELVDATIACVERERRAGAWPFVTFIRLVIDALSTFAPSTQHRALSTQHRALSTQHRALSTQHRAPSTGDSVMHSFLCDVRHAVRMVRRAPLFSALVAA